MTENFNIKSSVADDVWHPNDRKSAYEWWYFDAISDDGRDVVTIIFFDNFVFSPLYNRQCAKRINGDLRRFPAVAFVLYRDGKPIYRALNEFEEKDFKSKTELPFCQIGESKFEFEEIPYGNRYILSIDAVLSGEKRIRASLEWLLVESDFNLAETKNSNNSHFWNLVSPRSDVTGKIEVSDRNEKLIDLRQFRGTGYHDHNSDSRWLPDAIAEWQWGRAHFVDATAIFYRFRENGNENFSTKLLLVKNKELEILDSEYEAKKFRRDIFGLKYPSQFRFQANGEISLNVRHINSIDSSFFYLRFLSELTLDLGDGKPRKSIAITEHLAPKSLKFRWLDWLVNMRIGRNGKGSALK